MHQVVLHLQAGRYAAQPLERHIELPLPLQGQAHHPVCLCGSARATLLQRGPSPRLPRAHGMPQSAHHEGDYGQPCRHPLPQQRQAQPLQARQAHRQHKGNTTASSPAPLWQHQCQKQHHGQP